MTVSPTKFCCHCSETKPIEEFVWCKGKVHTYCKKCQTKKSKAWRESNRTSYLEQQRVYRDSLGYEGRKNNSMRSKYGISLEDYKELLELQNNCCAICHGTESYEFDVLVVDHDHITGKVRGLLCTRCNKGLGMFSDSVLSLENAAEYLRKF